MEKIKIFFILFFVFILPTANANQDLSEEDAIMLLDLLGVTVYRDNKSKQSRDSLVAYNEWEKLYVKVRGDANKEMDEKEVRNYLFLLFIVETVSDMNVSQDVTETFYKKFSLQDEMYMKMINRMSYLEEEVCYLLAESFYWAYKDKLGDFSYKEKFIKLHNKSLYQLSSKEKCLNAFTIFDDLQ